MNRTLCMMTTDAELNELHLEDMQVTRDNAYATEPMAAIRPVKITNQLSEEELHTSFEQAISERVTALQERLQRLSDPELIAARPAYRQTTPLANTSYATQLEIPAVSSKKNMLVHNTMQRVTLFTCLAMMFMMLGFDMMGLLVMNMR